MSLTSTSEASSKHLDGRLVPHPCCLQPTDSLGRVNEAGTPAWPTTRGKRYTLDYPKAQALYVSRLHERELLGIYSPGPQAYDFLRLSGVYGTEQATAKQRSTGGLASTSGRAQDTRQHSPSKMWTMQPRGIDKLLEAERREKHLPSPATYDPRHTYKGDSFLIANNSSPRAPLGSGKR